MIKHMTISDFENYKAISDKVLDLLIAEKYSSLKDIKIIYNIIMGFPYCLDQEGHFTYQGVFYNSLEELPDKVKSEIINHSNRKEFLYERI